MGHRMRTDRRVASGFTLVELLVVIAIIGILVALLLPAVQAAREAAHRIQCANNIRQLGLAMQNHHDSLGAFPPGITSNNGQLFGYPRVTWVMHLFPYLEESSLHAAFDIDAPPGCGGAIWMHPANYAVVEKPVQLFRCPSDSGDIIHDHPLCRGLLAKGNYAGFFGNISMGGVIGREPEHRDAVFQLNDGVEMRQIADGTSKTMLIGEIKRGISHRYDYRGTHWYDHVGASQIHTALTPNSAQPDWLYPIWCPKEVNLGNANLPCRPGSGHGFDNMAAARSSHPGGVQVAMGDGSVRFVNEGVSLFVWQAMSSIADEEVFEMP